MPILYSYLFMETTPASESATNNTKLKKNITQCQYLRNASAQLTSRGQGLISGNKTKKSCVLIWTSTGCNRWSSDNNSRIQFQQFWESHGLWVSPPLQSIFKIQISAQFIGHLQNNNNGVKWYLKSVQWICIINTAKIQIRSQTGPQELN